MPPTIVVAVAGEAPDKWCERLQSELPGAAIHPREAARAEVDPAAVAADYALVWRPHASLFAEQPRLKAIFNLGAGIDALAAMPGFPRDVPLIRLEDAGMAQPMANYVLATALRFACRFDAHAKRQRERRWEPKRPRNPAQLKVGVMGLGAIGRTIAQRLAANGFAVRGYARSPRHVEQVEVFDRSALHAFLDGLDLLVNALPLTAETTGILCRANLQRLADGAQVVNLARGAHLIDDDLLALLDSGKLAGATLDVFREEPLPTAHPFWSHEAIVVTPHVAGVTVLEDSVRQVADKIRLLERNLPVSGVVDWKRGY
jgi:glyoxylate/hydroxypyruvate reductase